MSGGTPVDFLRALAQALSAMSLYSEGHPARSDAVDEAYDALREHLSERPGRGGSQFSFLEGEVIHGDRQIRKLRDWPWSRLLPEADVDRVEFEPGVERSELVEFLETVRERLDGEQIRKAASGERAAEGVGAGAAERDDDAGRREGSGSERAEIVELPCIRFGPIRRGEAGWGEEGEETAFEEYGLDEELDAVRWLMEEAGRDGSISGLLAGAVVKSISVALHEEEDALRLLAPLKTSDEYSTVHSMNAATLSMGLAESLGLTSEEVHTVGQAALLHDTGKTRIPEEILKKEGSLTDEEWAEVRKHPEEGARILLNSDDDMEIPALVAYEHHLWWDGSGGYPELRYPRKPHRATQIVHVCDIYDALRTERPYREAWDAGRVKEYLREQAGTEFDPDCVEVLLNLLESTDERTGPGGAPSSGSPGRAAPGSRAGEGHPPAEAGRDEEEPSAGAREEGDATDGETPER